MNDITAGWTRYIARKIEKSERKSLAVIMSAVGEVLAEEKAKMKAEFKAELDREVGKLKAEFWRDRLEMERGKRTKPTPLKPVRSLIA